MNKINVYNPKQYPIDKDKIKAIVNSTLDGQKIWQEILLSILFVDDRKMAFLHFKYLKKKGTTDGLSFPIDELKSKKRKKIEFKNPDNITRLGDIVVCYPQAKRQAKEYGIIVSEEVDRLVEHGLLHLLGIHHEE